MNFQTQENSRRAVAIGQALAAGRMVEDRCGTTDSIGMILLAVPTG